MKKKLICTFFAVSMLATQVYATNYYPGDLPYGVAVPAGVLCNAKKTKCTVGYYTMRTTNIDKPLYVNNGIVCNHKRTKCTNGFSMMRTSQPQY